MLCPEKGCGHHDCGGPRAGDERPAPSLLPTGFACRLHRVGADRLDDILDPMATERPVMEIQLMFDLLVDGLRNAYRAGFGERLQPGGDVDAIAEDVGAIDNDI